MYDLLLKGATLIDPDQEIHSILDVSIKDGEIAGIFPNIPESESKATIHLEGNILTPGLIDIHAHVYRPGRTKIHPDVAGVLSGVTTMVDAGGTDGYDFQVFNHFITTKSKSTIYSFLNITQPFAKINHSDEEKAIVAMVQSIATEFPQLVKGIKVSIDENTVIPMGLTHLEFSKRAARESGIRLMMHIGDFIGAGSDHLSKKPFQNTTSSKTIAQAISMLDPGDVLTHAFTPRTGGVVDKNGYLLPALTDAQLRGVTIDTAYGSTGFGFRRAEEVLAQGFVPDTIGSDVEIQAPVGARRKGNRGLIEYLAFYLALGFSLDDVVKMTTNNPAKALGINAQSGSLQVGRKADISVMSLLEGEWELVDAQNHSRLGSKALVPLMTIKSGHVIDLGEPPHPWGWTPPRTLNVPFMTSVNK